MTDDLDKFAEILKANQPKPDADKRAQIIAAATKDFGTHQGSANEARPTSDHPHGEGRILDRIKIMLNSFNPRSAILATSSFAVLAVAVVIINQPSVTDMQIEPKREAAPLEISNETAEIDLKVSDNMRVELQDLEESSRDDLLGQMVASEPATLALRKSKETEGYLEVLPAPAPMQESIQPADVFPDNAPANLQITQNTPVSTFSVDVDTTSYAMWRMATLDGYPIPKDAIRVEEMINYFDYAYPQPESLETPFSTSVAVMQTPWNENTQLMQIGIQGYDVAAEDRPPMGLVFLIDTSGSMEDPMKLPLLRKSFNLLLNTLSPEDTVAIVTYAGSAGLALEPTNAGERSTILNALDQLRAGGSTAGQAGLQQAYAIAETMREDGQQARIILATDGDFNVGISDPDALKDYVAEKRDTGVYLSVLGFGRGNYTDTIMQSIAHNGNGVAAYIDSLAEAQKVLVEDVTGSLLNIASDVKIQVEFNPAQISEYRLIGYETRALNREDFNNDKVDAGDIGAGHTVTAIYEITPKGSPAELTDPLRYETTNTVADRSDELAYVKLRHKKPGEDASKLIETPVYAHTNDIAQRESNFAAAVAAAGQLLRGQDLGEFTLKDARDLASANKGSDDFGYRAEFIRLLDLARAGQD